MAPIPAGTEVSFSYVDETLPLRERQAYLLLDYGFQCICSRCLEASKTHGGHNWTAGTLNAGPVHTAWQLQNVESYEMTTGQAVVRALYDALHPDAEYKDGDPADPEEWEGGVAPCSVVEEVTAFVKARAAVAVERR